MLCQLFRNTGNLTVRLTETETIVWPMSNPHHTTAAASITYRHLYSSIENLLSTLARLLATAGMLCQLFRNTGNLTVRPTKTRILHISLTVLLPLPALILLCYCCCCWHYLQVLLDRENLH